MPDGTFQPHMAFWQSQNMIGPHLFLPISLCIYVLFLIGNAFVELPILQPLAATTSFAVAASGWCHTLNPERSCASLSSGDVDQFGHVLIQMEALKLFQDRFHACCCAGFELWFCCVTFFLFFIFTSLRCSVLVFSTLIHYAADADVYPRDAYRKRGLAVF